VKHVFIESRDSNAFMVSKMNHCDECLAYNSDKVIESAKVVREFISWKAKTVEDEGGYRILLECIRSVRPARREY